jgi:hypothetical protein
MTSGRKCEFNFTRIRRRARLRDGALRYGSRVLPEDECEKDTSLKVPPAETMPVVGVDSNAADRFACVEWSR